MGNEAISVSKVAGNHVSSVRKPRTADQRHDSVYARKAREAAKDFEAYFVSMMLREMRKTVPKSGLLDSGISEEIYRDMFDQAVAQQLASSGSIGLAKLLLRDFGLENTQRSPEPSL